MYFENSSEGLCCPEENLNQQMKMLYGDSCESSWLLQTVHLLSKHFANQQHNQDIFLSYSVNFRAYPLRSMAYGQFLFFYDMKI